MSLTFLACTVVLLAGVTWLFRDAIERWECGDDDEEG